MRYPVVVFLLLSCNAPKPTTEIPVDSVSVAGDSIVMQIDEGDDSSFYSIEDQVRQMTFPLDGKTYDAQELLAVLYRPDHLDENTADTNETTSSYTITNATALSGNFFKTANSCESRTLLLTKRLEIDAEYYDVFFLGQEADGTPMVADKISFDGSQGQSDTQLDLVTEGIGPDKACYALKLTSSTEGGDINLHRDEWVEYYIADGQAFHSVIRIILEETDVEDYEVSQDENKDATSEMREYEFLTSVSNGLFDISIHTVVRQNGNITSESDQTFRFNGQQYE